MSVSRDLVNLLKESENKGTSAYDTQAEVVRVEGDTAWVNIPGGVAETPVQKTIGVSVGDKVQVRLSGGDAWLVGNATAPPTDDRTALAALNSAEIASGAAASAVASANSAQTAAQDAINTANSVRGIAQRAEEDAAAAHTAATNASEYAARALGNLSTVQNVTETLTWITQHGTMTPTTDTSLDPTHVYFIEDENGDYEVGGTKYAVVTEPNVEDISNYFELSIDESLNNYVATHLAVTSEGLWIIPDAGGNKVLIATGQGETYTDAGTYIIGQVGGVDTTLARFAANGIRLGESDDLYTLITNEGLDVYGAANTRLARIAKTSVFGASDWSYASLTSGAYRLGHLVVCASRQTDTFTGDGTTKTFYLSKVAASRGPADATCEINGQEVTNYRIVRIAAQQVTTFIEFTEAPPTGASISIRYYTTTDYAYIGAYNDGANAGNNAFAVGVRHRIRGAASVALNYVNHAYYDYQTVIGKYNDNDQANAFEIGNGTGDYSLRSNAFTVAWNGDTTAAGEITDGAGNVLSAKANTTDIPDVSNFVDKETPEFTLDTSAAVGTTDGDLYAAITALQWESEVIDNA